MTATHREHVVSSGLTTVHAGGYVVNTITTTHRPDQEGTPLMHSIDLGTLIENAALNRGWKPDLLVTNTLWHDGAQAALNIGYDNAWLTYGETGDRIYVDTLDADPIECEADADAWLARQENKAYGRLFRAREAAGIKPYQKAPAAVA